MINNSSNSIQRENLREAFDSVVGGGQRRTMEWNSRQLKLGWAEIAEGWNCKGCKLQEAEITGVELVCSPLIHE